MKRFLKVISLVLSLMMIISMVPFTFAGAATVSKSDSDANVNTKQSSYDDQGVKSIEVTKIPDKQFIAKNEYYLYQYYMLYGMEIKVTYDDGTEVIYNYENDPDFFGYDLEFSGDAIDGHFMIPELGENTIYVTYGGQTAPFTISCIGVDEFEITRLTATKDFIADKQYQILGSIDYEIRVKYSDGQSQTYSYENDWGFISDEISFSGDCITDGSNFTLNEGENTLYMNCGGKSDEFQLIGLGLKNIEIIETPNLKFLANKTYDTSFDLLGLSIKVTYNDDTSKTYYFNYNDYPDDWDFFLGDVTYSGDCMDDSSYFTPSVGENTITITYGDKSVDFKFTAFEVTSIKINSSPYYNFIPGINYYLMYYLYGLEITAEYSDNSTETYKFDNDWNFFYNELKYSGKNVDEEYNLYITPELGENTITITYGSASADFTISAFNVESMELVQSPTGTFIAGEEYDPDFCFEGMQVRVNYSNNTTVLFVFNEFWYFFQEELEFSSASINENGYFIPVVGENKITASCDGKSFDFVIYADYEVDNIEITSQPAYTEFIAGEEYNIYDILTGMGLTVNYVSEGTKTYTYEENEDLFRNLKFSGDCIGENGKFTPSVGENVITVTYRGKTAELKLTGVEPEPVLVGMAITASPAQTEFTVGNEYNIYDILAGMEVTLTYSNETTQVYTYENNKEFFETLKFSGDCISEDGKFTPSVGENVITVTYEEKTAELKLTGVEPEPVLVSMAITAPPAQTEFTVGNEYNIYDILAGMEVTLTYSNETTQVYTYEDNKEFFETLKFSGDCISEDGKFTPSVGENVITVTYEEKTAELKLTGVEPEPVLVSMAITAPPAQTEFTVGNEYNIYDILAGMEVTLTYSNETTQVYAYEDNKEFFETLKFSGDCISEDGKFTPSVGENVITVTYEEKTAELKLTGVEEFEKVLGDVDGDGKLTIRDATYIQLYLAGLIDESILNLDVADYDGDGKTNIRDVTIIQLLLAGLIDESVLI